MDFRKATSEDIPVLIKMRKQQLLDEGLQAVTNINMELNDYFNSSLEDGTFISWIALDNDKIVATSGICFYQLPPTYSNPTGKTAYITNMFTLNEYREQGLATKLFDMIIDEAKKRDYKIIRLHASSDGKSLYIKKGFLDTDGYMAMRL